MSGRGTPRCLVRILKLPAKAGSSATLTRLTAQSKRRGSVNMLRLVRLLLVVVFLILAGVSTGYGARVAAAGGIAVYPVKIDLKDALRGAQYLRTVTVANAGDSDLVVQFIPDGQNGSWMSVRDQKDSTKVLQQGTAPAQSQTQFLLQIAVPANAANGSYTGSIGFQVARSDASGGSSGMGVTVGIAASVDVTVTGTQNLSGVVSNLSVDQAEIDQPPVRLRFQFKNDGNVEARPVAHWQIEDQTRTVVGDVNYQDTVVQPGHLDNIVSEWDQTGKPAGKYVVSATITLGDRTLTQGNLDLEILPRGTLTRSGKLENVTIEGTPVSGTLAKVVARFRNTGQIDTHAIFTVELDKGDQVLQAVQSEDRLVTVGELALIPVDVPVKDAGQYRLKGSVNYGGKVTESQEVTFSVVAPAQPTVQNGSAETPVTSTTTRGMWMIVQSRVDGWLGSWIPLAVVASLAACAFLFTLTRRVRLGAARKHVSNRVNAESMPSRVLPDEQFSRGVMLHQRRSTAAPMPSKTNETRKPTLRPIVPGTRKRQ